VTRRPPALLLPWLAALLVIYLCAPFAAALQQAGLTDWRSVNATELWRALAVSVSSATVCAALIAVGGVPLGYCLARVPGRAAAMLGFIVQLPLAQPPLASGILLLFLVGPYAPLGVLTHGALTDSFAGIVLAETFVAAPFLVVAARSAFASVDPILEDVAATLGRGRLATFMKVSLPLAWPGVSRWIAARLVARLRGVWGDSYGRLSPLFATSLYLCRVREPGLASDDADTDSCIGGGDRRPRPKQH